MKCDVFKFPNKKIVSAVGNFVGFLWQAWVLDLLRGKERSQLLTLHYYVGKFLPTYTEIQVYSNINRIVMNSYC